MRVNLTILTAAAAILCDEEKRFLKILKKKNFWVGKISCCWRSVTHKGESREARCGQVTTEINVSSSECIAWVLGVNGPVGLPSPSHRRRCQPAHPVPGAPAPWFGPKLCHDSPCYVQGGQRWSLVGGKKHAVSPCFPLWGGMRPTLPLNSRSPGVRTESPALFPPHFTPLWAAEQAALPSVDAEQGCWGLAAFPPPHDIVSLPNQQTFICNSAPTCETKVNLQID